MSVALENLELANTVEQNLNYKLPHPHTTVSLGGEHVQAPVLPLRLFK